VSTSHSGVGFIGCLIADSGKGDWDELTTEYGVMLMEGQGVMGCKRNGRGQACERPKGPAPDRLPEDPPLQRGQGLPLVSLSSWASSKTTARGCCR
jgi:hypothetical protein